LIGTSNGVENPGVDRRPPALADHGAAAPTPLRLRAINGTLLEGHAGAGAYRNTSLPGGSSDLSATSGREVHRQEARIFTALEKENYLKGLPKEEFVERFAAYRTAFLKWGPFHGANQGSADIFLGEVALAAGYQVNLKDAEPEQLKRANSEAVRHGEMVQMRSLLRQHTRSTRAIAFAEALRTGDRVPALNHHPELQHAFSLVDQGLAGDPRTAQSALHSPRQDARLVQRVRSELEAGRLTREFSSKEKARFFSKVRELERAAR